jgi:GT2 family glycosyltransferase
VSAHPRAPGFGARLDVVERRPVQDDVTVLVPTLGRPTLAPCLEAMLRGTVWPRCVIVVDQGRSPDVEALLAAVRDRGLDARWIPSGRSGRSAGLNDGLAHATTRFVAITDDDCIVEPEWLERLTGRLRATPDAIVTGRVDQGEGEVNLAVVTDREASVQARPRLRFDRMVGGNMGIAKVVVDRVGGFDEDPCMRTAEDAEYAYRVLRAGVRIVYAPEVAVRHLGWRDDASRVAQYDGYARSHGGFYGKYLRRGDPFIAARAAVHLTRALRRWVMGTLRGRGEMARNGRAYVLGLLPGIAAGWRSQGRSIRNREHGDR